MSHAYISTQNSNTLQASTTQMETTILWVQISVGTQNNPQTYPPTWRQKICTKSGGGISLLCKSSRPHHSGRVRHISNRKIKNKRRHQRISNPFNLLLHHKPRFQVEIPCQTHDIAHTQWCIINVTITHYKSCRRKNLWISEFQGHKIL